MDFISGLNAQNLNSRAIDKNELEKMKDEIDKKLQNLKNKNTIFNFDNVNIKLKLNGQQEA